MKLHENKTLFRDAVTITAQKLNIPEVYIEKDYWVTYVLHTIYNEAIGQETVFKGGTALSKCFNLVQRFSEDIDLIVLRREGESNNQLTNKIKRISKVVADVLPEIEIKDITQKMGMNRKTAHTYPKEFRGDYGQVRDIIVLEATWLGYYEPYTTRPVSSYVYEMMIATGQKELAVEYGLLPFNLMVLEPKRTLCEKIMSLVRFSYTETPLEDLKKKIRHTYDIYQLLLDKTLLDFFNSDAFDELLLKVANDDVGSFKNNNAWLKHHPNESLIYANIDKVWHELKETYNGTFRTLVFGEFPSDDKVLNSLKVVKSRLTKIKWTINLNSGQ